MKSRTSYFDKTILKKDLTRFWPLWALYLIGGLLIMHILSGFYDNYYSNRGYSIARDFNSLIGPLNILSACYAFLAAQLLFGDLHSPRLCYGVHAFPLRREGWYLTHVASGLLMGLVPPLVIVLTLMPLMGSFWFTGLLCWGGMALHYLFFFALSVLCMMVTGNRFAATAVYGLLNFLSPIVQWCAKIIYIPLLPGVRSNTSVFNLFCPVVELTGLEDFFRVEHLDTCPCHDAVYKNGYIVVETWTDAIKHEYGFTGLGADWGYLWILAGVGIALLVGGLLLYRIRHLERAGDFMAFQSMKPIFLWVYTLCAGFLMFYIGQEFGDDATGYFLLVIGILIGYFTGKMLLERTLRVFKGRSWAGLGILYAAVALSLLLTWLDPIGISRYIPNSDKVEKIMLSDGKLSDYQLGRNDELIRYDNVFFITEEADIAAFPDTHRLLLEAHNQDRGDGYSYVTIQYWMKNGTRITRTYYVDYQSEAYRQFISYLANPEYLFGTDSLDELIRQTSYLYLDALGEIPKDLYASLLEAMWLDAQEDTLLFSWKGDGEYYVELHTSYGRYRNLYFGSDAKHLMAWMEEYETSPQLLLRCQTLEELLDSVQFISCPDLDIAMKENYSEFLSLLWQDCLDGKVRNHTKWSDELLLELELEDGFYTLVLDKTSASFVWLTTRTDDLS